MAFAPIATCALWQKEIYPGVNIEHLITSVETKMVSKKREQVDCLNYHSRLCLCDILQSLQWRRCISVHKFQTARSSEHVNLNLCVTLPQPGELQSAQMFPLLTIQFELRRNTRIRKRTTNRSSRFSLSLSLSLILNPVGDTR